MRLIDADKFNGVICHIPEDVYDAQSYIRGMEDVINSIRNTKTVIEIPQKDVKAFMEWLNSCPIR